MNAAPLLVNQGAPGHISAMYALRYAEPRTADARARGRKRREVRAGCGARTGPRACTGQMPAAVDRSRLMVVRRSVAFVRAVGRSACVATGTTTSR
ncbi:hypothetical protein SALBM311S_02350 [Streptomyces alboniger]